MLEFGHFRLDPDRRILWHHGHPVRIGPNVVNTLAILVANADQAVSKDEIIRQVWGDTAVEENSIAQNISVLRRILKEGSSGTFTIETIPKRGYRFRDASQESALSKASPRRRLGWWSGAGVLLLVAGVVGYLIVRRPAPLTGEDTIVVAEFTNTTGDPIFDGTLRQSLSSQLEQSPFLNLLSDQRIAQTLTLLARPKDARLTQKLAREVCERTASAATIEGSIASHGGTYVLRLRAVTCRSRVTLANEEMVANSKDQVLKVLAREATQIREGLGESLLSVQKYDLPPENVTTASLPALQDYSLGYQAQVMRNDGGAAIPFFLSAVALDPNFAKAYARLAACSFNIGESTRTTEYARRAYDLRQRVSDRERFHIDAYYNQLVTGDLEAARVVNEMWAQTYPRDATPAGNLTIIYEALGYYDLALPVALKALRLNPGSQLAYENLAWAYTFLNRLDEATTTAQEAQAQRLDTPNIHIILYTIDFAQNDAPGMAREASIVLGEPGPTDVMLYNVSDTAAYGGQFVKARDLTQRAIAAAERGHEWETAGAYEGEEAIREALVGNRSACRQHARRALRFSRVRDVEASAAIALGVAGASTQAKHLTDDLITRFPQDTIVNFVYLPMARAAAVLGNPQGNNYAAKAVQDLAIALPYELGNPGQSIDLALYPIYLRGNAYLAARQGTAAAAEFRKIVDHAGTVMNEPIGALAHLGLGRAYVLSSDTPKAKTAYQDFFSIWKDADSDLPILVQAKAEYARLQ